MSVDLWWAPVELRWSSDRVRFLDAGAAAEYLRPFKADLYVMARFRRRLAESGAERDVSALTDDQVVEAAAANLASGRMWLWRQPPNFVYLSGQQEAPAQAPTEPPQQPERVRQSSGPEPEQPTLGQVDPAAQAQSLRNASRLGAPFCEECARLAAGAP